jgi:hypothetical protein
MGSLFKSLYLRQKVVLPTERILERTFGITFHGWRRIVNSAALAVDMIRNQASHDSSSPAIQTSALG